jgi:RNA polymerase sigma-70 factor, ECF subfamily
MPDSELARAQMRDLLERKLDELPENFRTVFVMRSVEEMSVDETAGRLGVPHCDRVVANVLARLATCT